MMRWPLGMWGRGPCCTPGVAQSGQSGGVGVPVVDSLAEAVEEAERLAAA